MEALQTLGIALGLATLAGLNLYLTVFVTGLAIQNGWIDVTQTHPDLLVLGHPAVIVVAGALYFLEFFADKVPWVDSLWDSVHTVIRPIGGAFLAIQVLGNTDPAFDVVAALLAGGVTLMAHSAKAGTRLLANHSPEPFTNVALSVTEDVAVLGGLALIKADPQLALAVFSLALLVLAYVGPKLFRAVRANFWLLWRRLVAATGTRETQLSNRLPVELDLAFRAAYPENGAVRWAVPCLGGAARGITGNAFGWLVATEAEPGSAWLVSKRFWRPKFLKLDTANCGVGAEERMLGTHLLICGTERKPRFRFIFDATRRDLARAVAASLSSLPAPCGDVAAVEPAPMLAGR